MSEPSDIVAAIDAALATQTRLALPAALAGRRVVVSSGPTHEPIDPVRFIANRSSGKQGHAIAAAAAAAGADVVLVSGPVEIADPPGVEVRRVETAHDMLSAVENALPADIFVSAAAVADWRVAKAASSKLKKTGSTRQTLDLVENPDILARIAGRNHDRPAIVVGFAAETDHLLDHARAKLAQKGCDMIVLNDVGSGSKTFGGEFNEVTILTAHSTTAWPRLGKAEIAVRLVGILAAQLTVPST